ncbi:unnamed protein product, partial [Timema podura]|nr:unnamed protein product [Timema podura]
MLYRRATLVTSHTSSGGRPSCLKTACTSMCTFH